MWSDVPYPRVVYLSPSPPLCEGTLIAKEVGRGNSGMQPGRVHLSDFVERISTAISRKPLIWCIIYTATNQSVLKRRRLSWRLGKKPQGPIAYRVKQAFPTNWKRTLITLVPYY